ncbi:hypothetical protein SDC9_116701 [bioreactor metagenome]|uniref:Uncharacterized protein n=1 Tax=bioreactor metagenome TaxID=1076179 RepID=A0A645C336_9ZZZZ
MHVRRQAAPAAAEGGVDAHPGAQREAADQEGPDPPAVGQEHDRGDQAQEGAHDGVDGGGPDPERALGEVGGVLAEPVLDLQQHPVDLAGAQVQRALGQPGLEVQHAAGEVQVAVRHPAGDPLPDQGEQAAGDRGGQQDADHRRQAPVQAGPAVQPGHQRPEQHGEQQGDHRGRDQDRHLSQHPGDAVADDGEDDQPPAPRGGDPQGPGHGLVDRGGRWCRGAGGHRPNPTAAVPESGLNPLPVRRVQAMIMATVGRSPGGTRAPKELPPCVSPLSVPPTARPPPGWTVLRTPPGPRTS